MNPYTTITKRRPTTRRAAGLPAALVGRPLATDMLVRRLTAPTDLEVRHTNHRRLRRAVTVIEVLFAMGVILIGLMGVAALVPVAGRDAAASLHADIAGRVAAGATAQLNAQGINNLTGVVIANNEARTADSLSLMVAPAGGSPPTPFASLASVVGALSSPGVLPNNGLLRASYCIDPTMVSTVQNIPVVSPPPPPFSPLPDSNSRNAYQPLRFPYYSEFYDAVAAPNAAISVNPPGMVFPRMYRIGFGPGLGGLPFRSAMLGQRMADGEVSLGLTLPQDDALPASQILRPTTSAGIVGARETLGDFNWIATLTPPVGSGNLYKLSVVALSGRPADPVLSTAPYTVTNPYTNPDSEKVVWVADAVSLGSTTEVLVYGSTAIQDDIIAGQWVMLSMQPRNGAGVATGPAVHQWYRVVQAAETETGPFTQPPRGTLTDVWRRRVVLDGPTWSFAFGNASVADDTYMTIVDGAIGVIESQVLIQ